MDKKLEESCKATTAYGLAAIRTMLFETQVAQVHDKLTDNQKKKLRRTLDRGWARVEEMRVKAEGLQKR